MKRRSFLISAPLGFLALLTRSAAEGEMTKGMPVGRGAWTCHSDPVIFPGWWCYKNKGYIGGPDTIDGTRTMAPSVVKVGDEFWMYYLAERQMPYGTRTVILRCTAPISDPRNFSPANIALEFPSTQTVVPGPGDSPEGYYAAGPYQSSVTPWLTPDGSAPGKDANGRLYPWYIFLASVGSSTGVARSMDGGVTFQLVDGKNPLFPFEVVTVNGVTRRTPVLSKSKPYDYGGCGSASVFRTADAKYHMFYTAQASGRLTLEDIGATEDEVGHPDGAILDIGIGYAESLDAVTFQRKTSQALGVTSPSAKGTGRVVDPRRRDAPNGQMEYIVSRPMVFQDVGCYRMLVSSHSKTYRSRSLHSADMINWMWDPSPAEGFLGLGAPGSFDSLHSAYPCAIRVGNTYHLWYTGNEYGHISAPNGVTGIGYATATAL